MEIILAIVGAMMAGIGAHKLHERLGAERRLKAVLASQSPRGLGDVEGCPAHGGWHFREGSGGSRRLYGTWDYRMRVQGILPEWTMMDWCARRAICGSGSLDFLPEALFGAEALSDVPEAYELFAEQGDLIVQSNESFPFAPPEATHPQVEAVARALCAAFTGRGTQPLLQNLVLAVEIEGAAEAMKLLLRHFPNHPETRALVCRAVAHEVAAVRVAAAQHPDVEGHAILQGAALDANLPAAVRRDAVGGLARRNAQSALLAVAQRVPEGVEDLLCEAFGHWSDTRSEPVLRRYVSDPDFAIAHAAIESLALVGTRGSLHALKARLGARPGEPLKSTLKVAIDLIVGRSPDRVAGNLSLLSDSPSPQPIGRVSMPPTPQD